MGKWLKDANSAIFVFSVLVSNFDLDFCIFVPRLERGKARFNKLNHEISTG